MHRSGMLAPIILFALVFVVMAWQLISEAGSADSPTIPIWAVVIGSISLLVCMIGGALWLAYRNRRPPPTDSQDHQN